MHGVISLLDVTSFDNFFFQDCLSGTAKCHDIRCKIGRLEMDDKVEIRIRSRLWESTLIEVINLLHAGYFFMLFVACSLFFKVEGVYCFGIVYASLCPWV